MPSLNRAREGARTIVCGSNLRQSGLGILLYADDNRGYTPPNLILYSQYMPYLLRDNNNHKVKNLGYLYEYKYLKNPKMYYCPSATLPIQKFNTDINPWWELRQNIAPDVHTFGSYYYYVRIDNCFWNTKLSNTLEKQGKAMAYETWRKLPELKNKAIVSDTIFYASKYPHYVREGFNVLYGDGAVKFWRDSTHYFKKITTAYLSDRQVYDVFNLFDKN